MMIHKPGNWKVVGLQLLTWLIAAALLMVAATLALSILSRFVGKDNFPSLTVLVGVIGSIIAISQFRSNAQEKKQTRARMLAFATQLANEAHMSLWRPTRSKDDNLSVDTFVLEPAVLAQRKPHLEEMARAVDALDLKELPSVESMAAVVELKAAMKCLSQRIAEPSDVPADLEPEAIRLVQVITRLGKERDNLYPVYELGNVIIQSSVERR